MTEMPAEVTLTGEVLMAARSLWESAVDDFADDPGDPAESYVWFDELLRLGAALGYRSWDWIATSDRITDYERKRLREYFLEGGWFERP